MLKFRTLCPCLILLGGAAISPAQIVQQKGGYLIFIKYTKGQVLKQNISMLAPSTQMTTNTQIITKCLDVDKKGIATLEVTTPTSPGKPPSKRKVKIDRHGKPIGNTIDGFSGNFMWPETPIKVGQSWDGNLDTGAANGRMRAAYKLTGFKTINGVKMAAISTVMDVSGQFDVRGSGMIYVRVSDGQLDNATFNVGLKQYEDSGNPTVLKLVMTIRNAK